MGRCLGCGRKGDWNTVLGEEALHERRKENRDKKNDLKIEIKAIHRPIAPTPAPVAPAPSIPSAVDPDDYTTWPVLSYKEAQAKIKSLMKSGFTSLRRSITTTFDPATIYLTNYPEEVFLIDPGRAEYYFLVIPKPKVPAISSNDCNALLFNKYLDEIINYAIDFKAKKLRTP